MRSNKFILLLLAIVASTVCRAHTDGGNYVLVREMLDTASGDYSTSYSYNAMGNVLGLMRRGLLSEGVYGCIDRLRYSYEGNRVVKIDDEVGADDGPSFSGAFHFVDGADAAVEYTYDENGNMTADLNRGISRIDYNCLNLPQTVAFSSAVGFSRTITYGYTADGEKTSATYTTSTDLKPWRPSLPSLPSSSLSSSTAVLPPIHVTPLSLSSRTDYCGNITYENDTVSRVLVDGGYITFGRSAGGQLSSPSYHFYVKDHLGNNRVVVDSSGNVEETNSYYPFGGLMAVNAYVRNAQPYKYIGKELDRMFGWNMLDHGARWYDAAICRWWSMDEMCEKQYCYNPFCNCMDNPVRHIDKDGKLPGDPFDSPDDAAANFGMIYNFWSIKENREISSYIYSYNDEYGNTKYSYNVPVLGGKSSVLPRVDFLNKGKVYGAVHTHARYDEYSEDPHYGNRFSDEDKDPVKDLKYSSEYLCTTNGTLKKFIKKGNQYLILTFKGKKYQLPSDPQDPTHNTNTIDKIERELKNRSFIERLIMHINEYLERRKQ